MADHKNPVSKLHFITVNRRSAGREHHNLNILFTPECQWAQNAFFRELQTGEILKAKQIRGTFYYTGLRGNQGGRRTIDHRGRRAAAEG